MAGLLLVRVVAVLLVRCAEGGRTFWGWTTPEWVALLGHDLAEFRCAAPAWPGDEARPCRPIVTVNHGKQG